MNFDAAGVSADTRKGVEAILKDRGASFVPATINRVSVACAPMAAWVVANVKFAAVHEQIGPLRAELAAADAQVCTVCPQLFALNCLP